MPQLSKTTAGAVAEATGSFEPLEDGVYHARLVNVEVKPGAAGPYWAWEYDVTDQPYVNRKLWNNTSLSEAALWKLKESFDAYGVETDSDTDELIGQIVKLVVSSRVIQQGARKGETANQIDRVIAADEGYEAPASSNGGSKTAGHDDDLF